MDVNNDLNVAEDEERPVCQTSQDIYDNKTHLYSWHVKLAHRNIMSIEKSSTECGVNVVKCDKAKERYETCIKTKGLWGTISYTG